MNKRMLPAAILLLVSILAIVFLFTVFPEPKAIPWEEVTVSREEYDRLKGERNLSEQSLVEGLLFNGNEIFADANQSFWLYSLVEGDENASCPQVTLRAPEGTKVAICGKIDPDSFREDPALPFLIYTDDDYQECSLHCTTLPVMNLEADSFALFDNRKDVSDRVIQSDSLYAVRGASTSHLPKTSFKLQMKMGLKGEKKSKPRSLLGMPAHSTWHLYAPYNDAEKVRNVFCAQLWYDSCAANNAFGVKNGFEYRFLEVFREGKYDGLYALGYPVNKETVNLGQGEYLFKKKERSDESTDIYFSSEVANQSMVNGYELKGGTLGQDSWAMLGKYNRLLLQAGPEDTEQIYLSSDIDNAIDSYLFFKFIQGVDNYSYYSIKNVYLCFKKGQNGIKVLYTPWDLDETFGSSFSNEERLLIQYYGEDYCSNACETILNPITVLLRNGDSEIISKIVERYRTLRESSWSDKSIHDMIDNYEAKIYGSGAYAREKVVWPDGAYLENEKIQIQKPGSFGEESFFQNIQGMTKASFGAYIEFIYHGMVKADDLFTAEDLEDPKTLDMADYLRIMSSWFGYGANYEKLIRMIEADPGIDIERYEGLNLFRAYVEKRLLYMDAEISCFES